MKETSTHVRPLGAYRVIKDLKEADVLTLSENARRVLEARYLRHDVRRRIVETPAEMFARVAETVASAESMFDNAAQEAEWREKFYQLLASLEFLPNTPALMNAGAPDGQLSACFVLPVPDTMEGILEAVRGMALIQRTGGGTGFSFSQLRPKGDPVVSGGSASAGPVSFMQIFDCVTERIRQGGKRRGANMAVLRVEHPDILDFIRAKQDERVLRNFNLSVGVTDAFMAAVQQGGRYALAHPRTGQTVAQVQAREVFAEIVNAAWRSGDPGLLFLDAIGRANPTPQLGSIEATNPCGEVPLLPHESCNLGSISLARFVAERNGRAIVLWEKLRDAVDTAVRFLDDLIEVNHYPSPAITHMSRGNRKIGLGVMGFADALVRLGISYDSDEAAAHAEAFMRGIAAEAQRASEQLAAERGVFPNWPASVYQRRALQIRNCTRTAIAPTGTIGVIADTSPSIEPFFALAYRRTHVLAGQTLSEINPLFRRYLRRRGLDADACLRELQERGNLGAAAAVPDDAKRLFVTALEIPPERHLQIQAAFQRHVDNSVSKTINLPHDVVPEVVAHIYLRAWELGLKGITIYRYGSRSSQVLELGAGEHTWCPDRAARCDPEECQF